MSKRWFSLALIKLLIVGVLLSSGCAEKVAPELEVVTGTSLIAGIVKDIAGDKVEVRNIIPPASCPGHYDIKPGDIETLAKGKVFIIHKWQQGHENIKGLIAAAKNPGLVIKVLDVKGNWIAPPIQAEAVTKIAAVLGEIDAKNSAYYQKRAEERTKAILVKGDEIQRKLKAAKVDEVKVICSSLQEGFVKWAGFEIVATYGRPEELTAAKVAEIIAKAKAAKVALVIDNLQSGPEAGKGIAQDIGAIQVTISNFPGAFKGTETWEGAIDRNMESLLKALAKYRR